jgi:hypothetical protein
MLTNICIVLRILEARYNTINSIISSVSGANRFSKSEKIELTYEILKNFRTVTN